MSQEKSWDVIVRERDNDQLLLMASGWCEFRDDVSHCIHNREGNTPCGGQCIPQRCSSKCGGTRSDGKPSSAASRRPLQMVVMAMGSSLDVSWLCLGIWRGFEQLLQGCFMAFATAGGLHCTAILKYPFPSPLVLSSTLNCSDSQHH